MEDEHEQLVQALASKIDNQSMMSFPQDSFGIPEQLFADSSSSETCMEDFVIGPDITTSEPTSINNLEVPESDCSKEPTPAMSQSVLDSMQPVALSSPLTITALPAAKPEVLKQANNKVFLIPMGSMDASMLQSSLKIPSGQNIIIVNPQDLIKSVEEKRLKANVPININEHTAVHPQNRNIAQGIVTVGNQKISTQASPNQALPIVQAHGTSQVSTMEANVQANLVKENQGNQLRKKNQAEKNLQANRAPTQAESKSQTSIQVGKPGGFSDQNLQAHTLRASQVNRAVKPALDKPKVVVQILEGTESNFVIVEQSPTLMTPLDQVSLNKLASKPAVSIGQPVVKASREIQTKRALQAVKIMNNFEIQAQKSMLNNPNDQPVKVQQTVQTCQTKPTPLHTGTTSCKVSHKTQIHQTKPPSPMHLNGENTSVKSNVSQGMQTMPSKETVKPQYNTVQTSPTKAVMGIPKTLQESLSKVKTPIPQGNYIKILPAPKDSTKIQIMTDQPVREPQNSTQATPIARAANWAATASAFSQVSVPKMSSSTPVAAPKVHGHATSVWPSTKTHVVNLEEVKNKSSIQPSQNELNLAEKSGVTKTVSVKGPTLLGELEKRGSYPSATARSKSVRWGESQLMPLKHSKVSTAYLWTCSLCGKSSFEDMLGCLFGPYNENKDALQDDDQIPGHKRKHDSTSDETESPTKSKSESSQEFWFHGDCIVWTPGVYAMGESLAGYKQAVNDGRLRKCSYCGDFGATVTCLQRSCKKLYHFPCAKKAECVFEDSNYTIRCGHHK